MTDFGEAVGPFINRLIRSVQEEADRFPPMVEALKEFDPTPQQIGTFAGKCVELAAQAAADIARGVQEAGRIFNDPPPDFDVPDDLRDLK
jgi:hypothetical protein